MGGVWVGTASIETSFELGCAAGPADKLDGVGRKPAQPLVELFRHADEGLSLAGSFPKNPSYRSAVRTVDRHEVLPVIKQTGFQSHRQPR